MFKCSSISHIFNRTTILVDKLRPLYPGNVPLRYESKDSCVWTKLITPVTEHPTHCPSKVTIVGAGQVGMSCAFAILTQKLSHHVALVDANEKLVQGEMLDLMHGSPFLNSAIIESSTDFSVSAGSKVCIVTAGVRQKKDETRLQIVGRNVEVFKKIIPQLVKYSPNSILLIVTNPVDVLTYVSWKLSGLPRHRVIGSGTNLDTARFQYFISNKLNVSAGSVQAWIIGEHGDSSVPVWSDLGVGGMRLRDLYPDLATSKDKENWKELHKCVLTGGVTVRLNKGYTSWAVGLSVADLVSSLLSNDHRVLTVSTFAKGQYGIESDVVLSLPVYISSHGVADILKVQLEKDEVAKLKKSEKILAETIKEVLPDIAKK